MTTIPKSGYHKVDYYRVGADTLIAEFGDVIAVHDGIVIGAYKPHQLDKEALPAAPYPLIAHTATPKTSKGKATETLNGNKRRPGNSKPPDQHRIELFKPITPDFIRETITKLGTPTLNELTQAVKQITHLDVPAYIVRDRTRKISQVEFVKVEGAQYKRYQLVQENAPG